MKHLVCNHIKVYGNKKDLKKFKDAVANGSESKFSFEKIIPLPKDDSALAYYIKTGFHQFKDEIWGTVKDAFNVELSDKGNYLYYYFNTTRMAVSPWYCKMVESYTTLDFDIYIEEPAVSHYVIATRNGKFTRFIHRYLLGTHCPFYDQRIVLFTIDLLNNTVNAVEDDEPFFEVQENFVWTENEISFNNDFFPYGIHRIVDDSPREKSYKNKDDDDLLAELDAM